MTTTNILALRNAQRAIETGQWLPIDAPTITDNEHGYAVAQYRNGEIVETVTFNREGVVVAKTI